MLKYILRNLLATLLIIREQLADYGVGFDTSLDYG